MTTMNVTIDGNNRVTVSPIERPSPFSVLAGSSARNSLISDLMGWSGFIDSYSDLLQDNTVTCFTGPLGLTVNYMASVMSFADIIKSSILILERVIDLYEDYTVQKRCDLMFELLKLTQRVVAFVYRLFRLGVFVGEIEGQFLRIIKDLTSSLENIWEVLRGDALVGEIKDLKLRDLQVRVNSWKFADALVKIAFHAFGMMALLSVSVISSKEILIVGCVSVIISLITKHVTYEKESQESIRVVEKVRRLIREAA